MKFLFIYIFIILAISVSAQSRYTIKGKISNIEKGEALVGASIGTLELPQHGALVTIKGIIPLPYLPVSTILFLNFWDIILSKLK